MHLEDFHLRHLTVISQAESHWDFFYVEVVALYQREIAKKFSGKKISVKYLCGSDAGHYLEYDARTFGKHGAVVVQRAGNEVQKKNRKKYLKFFFGKIVGLFYFF